MLEVKRIAEERNLSVDEVMAVVESPYKFIRKKMSELSLPDELSEEEFYEQTKNFNIPSIGKLYASYNMYKMMIKNKNK